MFDSTISDAENKFISYLPKTNSYYSNKRNYSFDPETNENTTSLLSPYIRYRLLSEEKILNKVLNIHSFSKVEKYVQEIFWRTYWKGWLEHRPKVYSDYLNDKNNLYDDFKNKKYYLNAINGNTNLSFFNTWVNDLKNRGYLHNHIRMWFASIWIFNLKLPWQLGADFFMQHLLDGDPASNTLSWRWVAGLHTKGKTYLARPSNIMKFTNNRYHPQNELANFAKIQTEDHTIMPNSITYTNYEKPRKVKCLLIHENDVSLEDIPNFDHLFVQKSHCSTINRSNLVKNYVDNLLSDCLRRSLKKSKQKPKIFNFSDKTKLKDFVNENEIKNIFTHYPGIGYLKDELNHFSEESGVNMKYFITDWDSGLWPHASKGFFKLKKKIPEILGDMLRDQT